MSTFLSAVPHAAWEKGMAGWCVDTSTLAMQNPRATFISMQKSGGGRRLLWLPIIQRMFKLLGSGEVEISQWVNHSHFQMGC